MAINLPGPYEIEYLYTVNNLVHALRLNCITDGTPTPGDAFSTIDLVTKSGGSIALQTAIDDVWEELRKQLTTTSSAGLVTLWKYVTGTYEKNFISSGSVTNPAGTSGGAARPAGQVTISMRTAAGGYLKMTALETVDNLDQIVPLVAAPGISVWSNLALYMLSSSGWILGRDGSFPIAPLNQSYGQNESTYRARFRP